MSNNTLDQKIKLLTVLMLTLTGVHIVNTLLHGQLSAYGIFPGDLNSLPGIFTAPFIHGSWGHLFNNLFGLAVFSSLCLFKGIPFYLRASFIIITVTGLLVWLFGRKAMHIGASGWVFGLWSLSIATAWFDRRFVNIATAVFVVFFYGGMIVGVLPGKQAISYESHLFGVFSGILCAYLTVKRKRKT